MLNFETRSIVVFDLEMTAWEGSLARRWSGPGEHREVVQFGAIRLDVANDFRETASLSRLVRPRLNPMLSAYFTALTGITQAMVDADGLSFEDALTDFIAFVADDPAYCFGSDRETIEENCALLGTALPPAVAGLRDFRKPLCAVIGVDPVSAMSGGLPERLGLAKVGQDHDALADSRALAAVLRHLRAQGVIR